MQLEANRRREDVIRREREVEAREQELRRREEAVKKGEEELKKKKIRGLFFRPTKSYPKQKTNVSCGVSFFLVLDVQC